MQLKNTIKNKKKLLSQVQVVFRKKCVFKINQNNYHVISIDLKSKY